MNKLSEQEFQDRIQAVARARKIFIDSGLTRNISDAFTLYQEVLAEQDRALTLQTEKDGNRPRSILDEYKRPRCPLCPTGEIMFRPAPDGPEGYSTELMCSEPACNGFWYSKTTIPEWGMILQEGRTDEVDFSQMIQGSKKTDRKAKIKFTPIFGPCPQCGTSDLYELAVCCGAPEGLVECGACDFQELPSTFHGRSN
jgi:hypothetical protein